MRGRGEVDLLDFGCCFFLEGGWVEGDGVHFSHFLFLSEVSHIKDC